MKIWVISCLWSMAHWCHVIFCNENILFPLSGWSFSHCWFFTKVRILAICSREATICPPSVSFKGVRSRSSSCLQVSVAVAFKMNWYHIQTINLVAKVLTERTEFASRQSVKEEEYLCHIFVRQDGLVGVCVSDQEYPNRVAHTLITRVMEDFSMQVHSIRYSTIKHGHNNFVRCRKINGLRATRSQGSRGRPRSTWRSTRTRPRSTPWCVCKTRSTRPRSFCTTRSRRCSRGTRSFRIWWRRVKTCRLRPRPSTRLFLRANAVGALVNCKIELLGEKCRSCHSPLWRLWK